ncbi:DUF3152 domain-containing protein [Streptomyces paludis]|uniref:DUF3152 domain-containing protein n=1 Tax=Streptomyces paludis TaxID=2282738 RepID=A0A345HTU7_9ACTN|nr:DUF3152 domain-containing protein [Streptomyces paludis]AXG80121.1 DUF3152 domain-containing protein [Streptomyces paludis]
MGRHSRRGPVPQDAPRGTAGPADGGSGRRGYDGAECMDDYGTPAHGSPLYGYGTPSHGVPVYGAPAYGTPAHGTPQYGTPQYGTPAHGVPQVRGGHPEQRESGGGWGSATAAASTAAPAPAAPTGQRYGDWRGGPRTTGVRGAAPGATAPAPAAPRTVPAQAPAPAPGPVIPAPRREFVDAFDGFDAFQTSGGPAARPHARDGARSGVLTGEPDTAGAGGGTAGDGAASGHPGPEEPARAGKGRALTGIAAAALTTVLAVVVAGQVAGGDTDETGAAAAGSLDRAEAGEDTSRSVGRATPEQPGTSTASPAAPGAPAATYATLMTRQFALDPNLTGTGEFTAVPGVAKAPGKGKLVRYRVDIENGLGLDGELFADAVQKTLNDNRSWAHNGAMTFERVFSGQPDFVITLASPGTTGVWCAKSGLDTTVDNVSCDSAATDRVMVNAYRWAQGAKTFGPKAMFAYRQMLINHEVGHRLGHNHESCRTPGELAPVMQQQTKTLEIDGIKCRPNPWVYPTA